MTNRSLLLGVGLALLLAAWASGAWAQGSMGEAQWIWHPKFTPGQVPPGTCYFRKEVRLRRPVEGHVYITAQDEYILYVNGHRIGSGNNWQVLDRYDVSKYLLPGRNVFAIQASNNQEGPAGVVARILIRPAGGTFTAIWTDSTWLAAVEAPQDWYWMRFEPGEDWTHAKELGELGVAAPWGNRVRLADGRQATRFRLVRGFGIQRVLSPRQTGSVIAMAFDEDGNLLFSRERHGLLVAVDRNRDGLVDTVRDLKLPIKNCQGILPLNGMLYLVGQGPKGLGVYRVAPRKQPELLLPIEGSPGEHGAHAITLGPDGRLYVLLGNHVRPGVEVNPQSPYRHWYEGDLVQPRFEDGGGHARGIKAPGGTIVRMELDGTGVEYYAGGFRNCYDMAFNLQGELFTYESDMEWDVGLPWYRPTRVLHVVRGGEYGWRSGWAKWPEYYLDSLPAIAHTGRGSPTGVMIYQHDAFPAKYHGALFAGDWTTGRILAVFLKPHGAGYRATTEVFVQGKPLNVTDLVQGPDGALYFCTGGRGTEGGVYRVYYRGVPARKPQLRNMVQAVETNPMQDAFGRNLLAELQERLGPQWDRQIAQAVTDSTLSASQRAAALGLMHLYGPFPSEELLLQAAQDPSPLVRAAAAVQMGHHATPMLLEELVQLLADRHPLVQRRACEALAEAGHQVDPLEVLPLLESEDRHVAWAAMRLLQTLPAETWQQQVIEARHVDRFTRGAAALLAVKRDEQTARAVLQAARKWLDRFLTDPQFVDLLRVQQLAMHLGRLGRKQAGDLPQVLAEEFPADPKANPPWGERINRELVRLLAHLEETSMARRYLDHLTQASAPQRLHLLMHAPWLHRAWRGSALEQLLAEAERARQLQGGYSLSRYVENAVTRLVQKLEPSSYPDILAQGRRWPTAALAVLRAWADKPLEDEQVSQVIALDEQLLGAPDTEAFRRLKIAVVAVLGTANHPEARAYLRRLFNQQPQRRIVVAMALAQHPDEESWPLLIRALPLLEGYSADEVLTHLAQAPGESDDPEVTRQVILAGLRAGPQGRKAAAEILRAWYGPLEEQPAATKDNPLAAWQAWFVRRWPQLPRPELPKSHGRRWTMKELAHALQRGVPEGDPQRGAQVFAKAQCAKCHRFGSRGASFGPDLTTLSRRFHKRETLQAILYPSMVVSDQYQLVGVVTDSGRVYQGMIVSRGPDHLVLLDSTGRQIRIPRDSVEQINLLPASPMPEGLLDRLTLQEIMDLFAYLYQEQTLTTGRSPSRR